jgi:hypothetical protein
MSAWMHRETSLEKADVDKVPELLDTAQKMLIDDLMSAIQLVGAPIGDLEISVTEVEEHEFEGEMIGPFVVVRVASGYETREGER